MQLVRRHLHRLGELLALRAQLLRALREFALFALGALAIELETTAFVAQLARTALVLLERLARVRDRRARALFGARARRERLARPTELALQLPALLHDGVAILGEAIAELLARATLRIRALAACERIALTLLGHLELALERHRVRALLGDKARELSTPGFGRSARAVGAFALALDLVHALLGDRQRLAQRCHLELETRELRLPRLHFARHECDLGDEAARHQLAVALGLPALPRQRAHLALHLGDEIVEAREIDRRLLEPARSGAAAIAIEADTGGLLEQLAAIVGAIGEQRVDHPRFDHHAAVGTQARSAHHVVDVAQPARCAVEHVFALAAARQAACDDDFLEGHRKRAVFILEVKRNLGDVHRTARRRALEDHLFHLRPAERLCALFAEHPADGVGDVGLAAAVGADHCRHARLEEERRVIGERLESLQLELRQTH